MNLPETTAGLALVGYGQRGRGTILPALVSLGISPSYVIDTDAAVRARARKDLSSLVKAGRLTVTGEFPPNGLDVAVVAVPHGAHAAIVSECANRGIRVLKEKPLALSSAAARSMPQQPGGHAVHVLTPRPYSAAWDTIVAHLCHLKSVKKYHYRYWRTPEDYRMTWRNDPQASGGGVLIDMGYHVIEAVCRLFGRITTARQAGIAVARSGYRVEESVHLRMIHAGGVQGEIDLSRIATHEDDTLLIEAHNGYLLVTRSSVVCRRDGKVFRTRVEHNRVGDVASSIRAGLAGERGEAHLTHHIEVMETISDLYAQDLRWEVRG